MSQFIARHLARACANGPLDEAHLLAAFRRVLGRDYRFAAKVAARLPKQLETQRRLREHQLVRLLTADRDFATACRTRRFPNLCTTRWPDEPVMLPAKGPAEHWQVPAITTTADLARWLEVSPICLRWLADTQAREQSSEPGPQRRYRYRWLAKRAGGARLIECPGRALMRVQRRILHGILDAIPPHDAAHAFRKGRGIIGFTAPHAGHQLVLKLDLEDFFPSITRPRVTALFMTAGYPESVAATLADLCVNTTPRGVVRELPPTTGKPGAWRKLSEIYMTPHLPQGAPTSPALANLCAYRLDLRLAALAAACGADYTRYADDLLFSGGADFARGSRRFYAQALAIILEEGFRPQLRKTRFMPRSQSQRAAGLVINEKPNTPRASYDLLKAILHRCATCGPAAENRAGHPDFRAHLAGRISHLATVHPARAEKLRKVFEEIAW